MEDWPRAEQFTEDCSHKLDRDYLSRSSMQGQLVNAVYVIVSLNYLVKVGNCSVHVYASNHFLLIMKYETAAVVAL